MKNRFLFAMGDGSVIDGTNGLQWLQKTRTRERISTSYRDSLAVQLNIHGALAEAASADDLGHRDWRLPTLAELVTLIEPARAGIVAIDPVLFPDTYPNRYWTSTTVGEDPHKIYYVDFKFGGVSHLDRGDVAMIMLVRDLN